jgi:hypothetical protein
MQAEQITIVDNTDAFRARLTLKWHANLTNLSLVKKIMLMRFYASKGKL